MQACTSQETFLCKSLRAFLLGLLTAQNCFATQVLMYLCWPLPSTKNMQGLLELGRKTDLIQLLVLFKIKTVQCSKQTNFMPKHFLKKVLL